MRKRIRASPFTRRLAVLLWPNRVHFRCRLSGSFRCSPPRLTATQLLQVLTQNTVPDGRGLSPRRIVTLHSARVTASSRHPSLPTNRRASANAASTCPTSFPPPRAKSGFPPPLPPTSGAIAWIPTPGDRGLILTLRLYNPSPALQADPGALSAPRIERQGDCP
jgi:hypothetical protein